MYAVWEEKEGSDSYMSIAPETKIHAHRMMNGNIITMPGPVEDCASPWCQQHALKEKLKQLQAKLKEYEGWSPDQFLRYQEEHKKLQADFKAQNVELFRAIKERDEWHAKFNALQANYYNLEETYVREKLAAQLKFIDLQGKLPQA